jgi:gluconate 2-dehydrogenase gamma chain
MGAGFFDAHQRATVEAAMARIIPTDDAPGAREAGTIDFLDRYLSGLDHVYAKPDGSGFETLSGRRAQAWQQRIGILRTTYVEGIVDLDRRSRETHGKPFVDLDPEQQDNVLAAVERPGEEAAMNTSQAVMGFAPVEPALQQASVEISLSFLALLALHTRQGFYADPIYGGNRGHVGWQTIGFPGPSSLAEVHTGRYTVIEYFADGTHEQEMEISNARTQA